MEDQGQYIFTSANIDPRKPQHPDEYWSDHNEIPETATIEGNFTIMEELPKELQQVDEEQLLQDKLKFWISKGSELKTQLEEAVSKVKFYEKAIKSYNKAFKK